jgi:hypothetical protein
MGNFTEVSVYETSIPKIETTDSVLGGADTAAANKGLAKAVNRTKYLKDRMDNGGIGSSKTYAGNLNSLTTSGFYYIQSGATNKPGATGQGWCIVTNDSSTSCAQFYLDLSNDTLYFRRITSGPTFNAWKLVKLDTGTDLDVGFLQNQVKSMIMGASESAVIISGVIPFNVNTGTLTLQISAGVALIDGAFVTPAAYAGSYPVYMKPDATYTTVLPGSGSYIKFDPYTSQYYADVQRRAMTYLGEKRLFVTNVVLASLDGTGLGKWSYKGWALCNGQNGTIDAGGLFGVGYKAADTDYDTVGEPGGAKTTTLTIANLPATPTSTVGWGLIKKSVSGESVTATGADNTNAGIEPNIVATPMDFPYAAAAGTPIDRRPPYLAEVWLQRI